MAIPFAVQQKILAFQFLCTAVRFAEVGRATHSRQTLERCAVQMRETYDSALLLSTRLSFTFADCCAFDTGSSYVEQSFAVLRERVQGLPDHTADTGVDSSQLLREWEPMWCDPGPRGTLPSSAIEACAVRRHLKKIEDAAQSRVVYQQARVPEWRQKRAMTIAI
jgi:hypothetical protein